MNILFYIDLHRFDFNKLNEFGVNIDNISIFTTSYYNKKMWKTAYPVFYYDDLCIDAQSGFFEGLLPKSYELTYRLLETCLLLPNLDKDRKDLVNSIPSKLHRVVSECLRAERTAVKIMDYFNPDKIYILNRKEEVFNGRIDSTVNFESQILQQFCMDNNIDCEVISFSSQEKFNQKIIKYLKDFKLGIKNCLRNSPALIPKKLLTNADKKQVIVVYLFSHMFYRNRTLWKYFNNDKEHYYLFLTDWLSDEQRQLLERNNNLSFIHIKGLLPTARKVPKEKIDGVAEIISACLQDNELIFSRDIISEYLANYIFGYYDNYIKNHKLLKSFIKEHSPSHIIFPSYWEVQPSLLILYCRKNNIPTTAIQAGIHPRGTAEISLTDKYGLFGEWDYKNLISSGHDKRQFFILGWPLGEFYKTRKFQRKKGKTQRIEILFLISISGSWQHFLFFPEDLIIMELVEIAEKFSEMNFTIRAHSGNDINKFQRLIENNKLKNINLSISGSLLDVLLKTDYTFTQYTTTAGFESILLDIPTFCLNLHGYKDASTYDNFGKKFIANSKDELIDILSQIKDNKDLFLSNYELRKEKLLKEIFSGELACHKLLKT